jgi:hypothetical protein
MQRFHQLLFAACLIALCWYAMLAVHELGHVLGAAVTAARIVRVVLNPLAISRTEVSPNPQPAVVVWLGPIAGCAIPLVALAGIAIGPRRWRMVRPIARFFAGFCLIANGVYISLGSFWQVGDAGEMLRTGTPQWAMLAFGAVAIAVGFYLWHTLGSLKKFFARPTLVTPPMAYVAAATLVAALVVGFLVSPR